MATVTHAIKITNTWKFSVEHFQYCIYDALNKTVIFQKSAEHLRNELQKMGSFASMETPYLYVSITRQLEWDVCPADIEKHLSELCAVGLLEYNNIGLHRNELLARAMATRSPPVDQSTHAAASAMVELDQPTRLPKTAKIRVVIPPITPVKSTVQELCWTPIKFTGLFRHVRTDIDYSLAGPPVPLYVRPCMYTTSQVTDLNDVATPSLPPIHGLVLPPIHEPVCPPAPRKQRRPWLWHDPLGARAACAKQLHF